MSDDFREVTKKVDVVSKGLEFCQYMEFGEYIGEDTREVRLIRAEKAQDALQKLPSAQTEQHGRVFKGVVVEYPTYSTYPEYEGKPYFSIKYTENGQGFIGYGTFKPEVLSEYLKEYFIPSAQPEQRWIPCKERMPYIDGEYLITKKCFGWNCKNTINQILHGMGRRVDGIKQMKKLLHCANFQNRGKKVKRMSDLKPCPFCVGKAILEDYGLNGNFKIVKCTECGARTKLFFKGLILGEDAREAWNRREGVDG